MKLHHKGMVKKMSNRKIIVALFGKAGAGKDSILKEIIKQSPFIYHELVSMTTRPPREYEKDGVDYFFCTEDQYIQNKKDNKFLETSEFRGWKYGTPKFALTDYKINIGVFNLSGIHQLLKLPQTDYKVIPIFIDCDDKERLLRQLNREKYPDCAEICRRFKTDNSDFNQYDLDFPYFTVYNQNRSITTITEELLDWLSENLLAYFLSGDSGKII